MTTARITAQNDEATRPALKLMIAKIGAQVIFHDNCEADEAGVLGAVEYRDTRVSIIADDEAMEELVNWADEFGHHEFNALLKLFHELENEIMLNREDERAYYRIA